jgi:putative endonuclease
MATVFYIYVLFSPSFDKYYIGYSDDPERRLIEHNTKHFNTYTRKYRPWILKAAFLCGKKSMAVRMEKFIKKQKSRQLLEMLCNPQFQPAGFLAQLVRVPDIRD